MLKSSDIILKEIDQTLYESLDMDLDKSEIYEDEILAAFQEALNETTLLNEGKASDFGHLVLDVVGVAGTLVEPVGITADAINALWYASEGKWVLASLSAVSMVPLVGDVAGKGGKIAIVITKRLNKIPKIGPYLAKIFTKLSDEALIKVTKNLQNILRTHKAQITGRIVKLIEKHGWFKWLAKRFGGEEVVVRALDKAITRFYGMNSEDAPKWLRDELGEPKSSDAEPDDPHALTPDEEASIEKSQGAVQSSASIMGGSIAGMQSSAKQKEIIRDLKKIGRDAKQALAQAEMEKKIEIAQDELALDPHTLMQLRDEPDVEKSAIINAEDDPARRKALRKVLFQEEKLVKTVIDFEELRSKKVDEMFLSEMGGWFKLALNWMFGGAAAPIAFRGTERELKSLSSALGGEKNFIETAKRFGLDHPTTYKSKSKLDIAIKGFEKETGLQWPFK